MKVLNELSVKDLKLNKKRSIVIIIGIILSTALICAVAGLITSFQQTFIETAKNADIEAIACSWGFRSFESLLAKSPSAIIDEPKYISKLF
jgi:ABC-type antimicrobial peptide transport system permease subunit